MTQKQALGRGLSALLPGRDDVPRETGAAGSRDRPARARTASSRAGTSRREPLAELAASIRSRGSSSRSWSSPRGEKFEIVAGERRWRAAALAGPDESARRVSGRSSSEKDLLEVALVENLQREDLNPLDAAEAYARLKDEFQLDAGEDRATGSARTGRPSLTP